MNRAAAHGTWKTDISYETEGLEKQIVDKTTEAGEQRSKEAGAAKKRDAAAAALADAKQLKQETETYWDAQQRSFESNQGTRKEGNKK